jgi:hypothetical protein
MNHTSKRLRRPAPLLVGAISILLTLAAMPLPAQFDSAEVLGTILDSSGAVVTKASVTLTNQDTGISTKTAVGASGTYTFSNVKIGVYTVSAVAPGFSEVKTKNIRVTVEARQRVDLTLPVGAVGQTIEVTGAAAMVETDSSERGQVVNRTTITELPLNGRTYSDLALLTTGVIRSPSTSREGSFNVNGLRSTYNNYLLDGVDNNAYGTSNQGFANQVAQPSPDTVAEFKVITNNYSAEYGRSGGATINVSMRSGTNRMHGTGYDFLRNTDLNAIGYYFGARSATYMKPTLQQNQFGGNLNGPIVKNRLFYFADYEGLRLLQRSRSYSSLPSLDERQGLLAVTVRNPQTGVVYPAGTQIPASAITTFAQKVMSQLPQPFTSGHSNNYQQLSLNKTYADKFDVKVDGQINDRMSSFLRFSKSTSDQSAASSFPGPAGGDGTLTHVYNESGSLGYTWTVSPSSILEVRFGLAHTAAGKKPPVLGNPGMMELYGIPGLPSDPAISGGLLPVSLSGLSFGRSATSPQFQNPLSFDYKVNYSKITGRHALKMGYEFVPIRVQVLDVNPMYGKDSYVGAFSKPTCAQLGQAAGCTIASDSTSYSLADFLFGLRSAYSLATDVIGNYRQHEHFAYVQDDFRVSSKLTLNLGLRWEFATPRWERDNKLSNYDPASNTMLLASNGSLYKRTLVNPDYKDFAPRVGFAYSFAPKSVVRGAYGMSYAHQNRMGSGDLLGINGPQVVIATVSQSNPLDPNFLTAQQGYPSGLTDPSNFNPLSSNVLYLPKDLRTPYVQSWFVSVQRELPWNLMVDLGYVGNHSVALPVMADYNQAAPQPTSTSNLTLQARRPNQRFSAISWMDPAGFSSYNGLQMKVERRFAGGFTFLNSFVWARAIDNSSQALDGPNGYQSSVQDVHNLAAEKGLSGYDKKFTDVLSAVVEVPVGRGRHFGSTLPGALDQVLGGWELSVINNALAGAPLTLRAWNSSVPSQFQTVGNLSEWKGGEAFRPNVTGPVRAPDGLRSIENYFNKDNVQLPTDPSHPFGNAGRGIARAPSLNQIDLGIDKNFRLPREGTKLQFRGEMFNVLNHTNVGAPNTDRSSASFGTIRSTYTARVVQLALKLTF